MFDSETVVQVFCAVRMLHICWGGEHVIGTPGDRSIDRWIRLDTDQIRLD